MFDAYKWLKTYKQFPIDDGYFGQASKFIRCIKWVDLINLCFDEHIESKKREAEEYRQKFQNIGRSKSG